MRYPFAVKKGTLALIKGLILAEICIALLMFFVTLIADYESLYNQTLLSRFIRYNYSLIVFSSILQLMATLLAFLLWQRKYYEIKEKEISDLITEGESHHLELKQTFRWDIRQNNISKTLEKGVMKTIAGFLNSNGGKLIIGVSDDRSIFGLEADYKTLAKASRDGFENHFNNLFGTMLGIKFRQFVTITFNSIDNKDVCLVEIKPADNPVYLNSNNTEEFFIRTGNMSTPLMISQATDYIKSRWS